MHDITTYGLYGWSKSLFEKLGWMTLAHQDCQLIQLKCYVENIHLLIQHIELKLQYLHGLHKKQNSYHGLEEKIHDMEILHGNMKVLKKHAEHLVKTCKKEKVVKKVIGKKMMKGGNDEWYSTNNNIYPKEKPNPYLTKDYIFLESIDGKFKNIEQYNPEIQESIISSYSSCFKAPKCSICESPSKFSGIIFTKNKGNSVKFIKCKFICNGKNHHEGYL
jgi:hypothetical protein